MKTSLAFAQVRGLKSRPRKIGDRKTTYIADFSAIFAGRMVPPHEFGTAKSLELQMASRVQPRGRLKTYSSVMSKEGASGTDLEAVRHCGLGPPCPQGPPCLQVANGGVGEHVPVVVADAAKHTRGWHGKAADCQRPAGRALGNQLIHG